MIPRELKAEGKAAAAMELKHLNNNHTTRNPQLVTRIIKRVMSYALRVMRINL